MKLSTQLGSKTGDQAEVYGSMTHPGPRLETPSNVLTDPFRALRGLGVGKHWSALNLDFSAG